MAESYGGIGLFGPVSERSSDRRRLLPRLSDQADAPLERRFARQLTGNCEITSNEEASFGSTRATARQTEPACEGAAVERVMVGNVSVALGAPARILWRYPTSDARASRWAARLAT